MLVSSFEIILKIDGISPQKLTELCKYGMNEIFIPLSVSAHSGISTYDIY
jgi:hypothetical protein